MVSIAAFQLLLEGAWPSPGPSPLHSGHAAFCYHPSPRSGLPQISSQDNPKVHESSDIKVTPVLRTVAPPQGSQGRPRGKVGGKGVYQWLLWQPDLPRWRKGKRRPCSRVTMATQILVASFEDKNHTLPTYHEVPRTPQVSLWSRGPNGMGHVFLVPQLISQTFLDRRAPTFLGEEDWGLVINQFPQETFPEPTTCQGHCDK